MAQLRPRLKVSQLLDMNPTFMRRHLSGIEDLARSMETHGQLFPAIVRDDMTIISGGRRVAAAQLLRWKDVDAVVTSDHNVVVDMMLEERKYNDDLTVPRVWWQTPMSYVETAYLIAMVLSPMEVEERMRRRRNGIRAENTVNHHTTDRRIKIQKSLGLGPDHYKALSSFGHTMLRATAERRAELEARLDDCEANRITPRAAHRMLFGASSERRHVTVPEERVDDNLLAKHQRERVEAITATLRLLGGELRAAFDYVSPALDKEWLNKAWGELNRAEKPFRAVRAQMRIAARKTEENNE